MRRSYTRHRGNAKKKVLPTPTLLSIHIRPPCAADSHDDAMPVIGDGGGEDHRVCGRRVATSRLRDPDPIHFPCTYSCKATALLCSVSCELAISVAVPRRAADAMGCQASGRESSSRK